nr:MAG TPA: cystatin [Caudoviricetes sp.]
MLPTPRHEKKAAVLPTQTARCHHHKHDQVAGTIIL